MSLQLSKIWPDLIIRFQNHINNIWPGSYFETFSDWRLGRETQEITKVISPLFNSWLKKELKKIGFELKEGKGMDYFWNGIDLEGKLSLSNSNAWTGNGFPKTNWHLLIKINFNNNGLIDGSFVCLAPINDCESCWTDSGKKDNFSTLQLRTVDYEKIILIVGTFKKNRVYLKPILV